MTEKTILPALKNTKDIASKKTKLLQKENKFRISHKKLLLTWPGLTRGQCELLIATLRSKPISNVPEYLPVLFPQYNYKGWQTVDYFFVLEEHKQTGRYHIHAYLEQKNKKPIFDSKNCRVFDLQLPNKGPCIHGEYKGARTRFGTLAYLMKDVKPELFATTVCTNIAADWAWVKSKADIWAYMHDLCLEGLPKTLILERVRTLDRAAFLKNRKKFLAALDGMLEHLQELETSNQIILPLSDFNLTPELEKLKSDFPSKTSVVLLGDSRTGKSLFARSLAVYLTRNNEIVIAHSEDDLRKLTPATQVLIIDDFQLGKLSREQLLALFGVDSSTIKARYSDIKKPAGLKIIVCLNPTAENLDLFKLVGVRERCTLFDLGSHSLLAAWHPFVITNKYLSNKKELEDFKASPEYINAIRNIEGAPSVLTESVELTKKVAVVESTEQDFRMIEDQQELAPIDPEEVLDWGIDEPVDWSEVPPEFPENK